MNLINCPIFREFIVCLSFTSRFLGYLENLGIMLLDIDNYIVALFQSFGGVEILINLCVVMNTFIYTCISSGLVSVSELLYMCISVIQRICPIM